MRVEEGGREGGGGRGADTELKTKTPHVNVGNKATAAAGLQNVPLATPKHHATEGRNDFQKHVAPGLDVPSGSC